METIPKIIHYVWFGKKRKSKLTEICINSWRRNLPDYKIVEWNEDNVDIAELSRKSVFFKKCYELELWAFVSDYVRLYVLYKEGGIYLDTDVEIIKSFNPFLNEKMFLGYEVDDYIGTAVIGSMPKHHAIKRLLEFYEKDIWDVDFYNNPIIFKYLIEKEPSEFLDCSIFPMDYFSPYHPRLIYTKPVETENTIAIHWYTQNWNMNRKGYVFLRCKHVRGYLNRGIKMARTTMSYYRKKSRNKSN